VGERADDRAPVEEERRGGVDPDPRPGLDVLADARARGRVVEAGAERLHVEPELACVAEEALAPQVLVVPEQDVLVLPEPALPSTPSPGGAPAKARPPARRRHQPARTSASKREASGSTVTNQARMSVSRPRQRRQTLPRTIIAPASTSAKPRLAETSPRRRRSASPPALAASAPGSASAAPAAKPAMPHAGTGTPSTTL